MHIGSSSVLNSSIGTCGSLLLRLPPGGNQVGSPRTQPRECQGWGSGQEGRTEDPAERMVSSHGGFEENDEVRGREEQHEGVELLEVVVAVRPNMDRLPEPPQPLDAKPRSQVVCNGMERGARCAGRSWRRP